MAGYAVYNFGSGERLNTGYPIFLSGKPSYFVFVVKPTSTIYSNVDQVLLSQRIETFSLLAGATVAIVVLIVFLIKWNTLLRREVQRRTMDLELSNEEIRDHLTLVEKELERLYFDSESKSYKNLPF